MDCAPGFQELLGPFDPERLDQDGSTAFGLWPDLTLACFNAGWWRFVKENGGERQIAKWKLGRNVLDGISGTLRAFYASALRECLSKGTPWEHAYECSSPEWYRQFHMTVTPLGQGEGLLVVHSLSIESPHDPLERRPHQPVESVYRDPRGFVRQCSNCRRVQRAVGEECWDWVPQWVRHCPAGTSHGLCPRCAGCYQPAQISIRV
jgi:hypothetical protein